MGVPVGELWRIVSNREKNVKQGNKMKSISQLQTIDKPRERLFKYGLSALKNYELIAILLGSGVKGKDIIKLSREIESFFNSDMST